MHVAVGSARRNRLRFSINKTSPVQCAPPGARSDKDGSARKGPAPAPPSGSDRADRGPFCVLGRRYRGRGSDELSESR